MRKSQKFSPEVVERAVRMAFEAKGQYGSQWAAIESIAAKIGCTAETLRRWVRQAERDQGLRDGPTTAEQDRINAREGVCRQTPRTPRGRADLQVAPSACRRYVARARKPELLPHIERVWQTNMQLYGADKVWNERRRARQGGAHHRGRRQGAVPARPGQPAVPG